MARNAFRYAAALAALAILMGGCRHRFVNPIAKNTEQPDKVLFDKAVDDLEHNRFAVARITLTTLINTYDSSEFLAKAKLAMADSWYREGDAHGLAQAEAEYKDFILFYPAMEEAAEAQSRICDIQYNQMEKSDRDSMHAMRAEDECRQVLVQFPNSKFAPGVEQKLRNIQENLATAEYKVGKFYLTKGSLFPAANRMQTAVDNYPLFSKADEALWQAALIYQKAGDHWEPQEVLQLTRVVRDYPLSTHVEEAKARLQALKARVPEPDPVAYARMKYELDNRGSISLLSHFFGAFSMHPNLALTAKSGTPQMQPMQPKVPANVPAGAAGILGTSGDVTVETPADAAALDTNPDARTTAPAAAGSGAGTPAAVPPGAAAQPATAQPAAAGQPPAAAQPAAAKGQTKAAAKKAAKPPKPPKPPKKSKQQPKQTDSKAPATAADSPAPPKQ